MTLEITIEELEHRCAPDMPGVIPPNANYANGFNGINVGNPSPSGIYNYINGNFPHASGGAMVSLLD